MQVVSGRYVSQSFDPESSDFSLVYSANVTLASYPTVIYLNEKFYYPNGYTVRYGVRLHSYVMSTHKG